LAAGDITIVSGATSGLTATVEPGQKIVILNLDVQRQ
jgi:hypothetical protein